MRRSIARLRLGAAMATFGMVLAMAGTGLCLWALYQYVSMASGPVAAALVTGLVTLGVAGGVIWSARRLTN